MARRAHGGKAWHPHGKLIGRLPPSGGNDTEGRQETKPQREH
jgi:hypothetical protein